MAANHRVCMDEKQLKKHKNVKTTKMFMYTTYILQNHKSIHMNNIIINIILKTIFVHRTTLSLV